MISSRQWQTMAALVTIACMNYLAHAVRFLDRPEFVAGTAVPDWLSVADRKVRLRPKHLEPWQSAPDARTSELANGIAQHLKDDDWFHATRGFAEVTATLASLFRNSVGTGDGFRCGFLGHIVTELLIDAVLIDESPDRLDRYYRLIDSIDPLFVEESVNRMGPKATHRLAYFIRIFQRERILYDYQNSRSLLVRINQVMSRVKLATLPDHVVDVLDAGKSLVRSRLPDLLPPEQFGEAMSR